MGEIFDVENRLLTKTPSAAESQATKRGGAPRSPTAASPLTSGAEEGQKTARKTPRRLAPCGSHLDAQTRGISESRAACFFE